MHSNANRSPAMLPVPALAAPALPALTGAVLCAVSLAASPPLQVELPKVSLPKVSLPKLSLPKVSLPNLDLPNFGKKNAAGAKAPADKGVESAVPAGKVKIRASNIVQGGEDAPSAAELAGRVTVKTIGNADWYKRFPNRRMPGANMDAWKDIARDIGPKM